MDERHYIETVRDGGRLMACILEPVTPFRIPKPGELVGPAFHIARVPLDGFRLPNERQPREVGALLASWSRLSAVKTLDAATLAHVMRILLGTRLASIKKQPPLPPLDPEEEKRRFRPTAAHPRAHRGTKDRPPKHRQPEIIDLRRWLAGPHGTHQVLRRLRRHWPEAHRILEREGYDRERLAHIAFPEHGVLDPHWQYHHRDISAEPPDMPGFSAWLLPLLRGENRATLRATLAASRRLKLAQVVVLRLRSASAADFIHWCRLVEHRAPGRELALATLLARWAGLPRDAAKVSEADMLRLDRSEESLYAHRVWSYLDAIERGVPKELLLSGFELADLFKADFDFEDSWGNGEIDEQAIASLSLHVQETARPTLSSRSTAAMEIWRSCGKLPGLMKSLKTLDLQSLEPGTAWGFLAMVIDLGRDISRLDDPWKWNLIAASIPRLFEKLHERENEYRPKYLELLEEIHWYFEKAERMRPGLPALHRLAARLSKPPFARNARIGYFLASIACCAGPRDLAALEELPDASFLKLEAACRRDNVSKLLKEPLFNLVHELRGFTMDSWRRFPAELLRAAKSLGVLSSARRDQLLVAFKKHPVMVADWEKMTPRAALKLLDPLLEARIASPMSRKLREHLLGRRTLTAAQVERGWTLFKSRLPALQLGVLERLAENELSRGASRAIEDDERHALYMMRGFERNRRAFRRFLNAHFSGDRDFLTEHPGSRRWFAAHPPVDRSLWLGGLTLERKLPKLGMVRIAVERDPLKALKLGTYVGSCLGLGGGFAYSAAAAVLDVNKQVLYARDRAGTVLARQLCAISEKDELVCFTIYPDGASRGIKAFFKEFDEQFAKLLGLDLHSPARPGEDPREYEIARIISSDWWDDGAWDFDVGTGTGSPTPSRSS